MSDNNQSAQDSAAEARELAAYSRAVGEAQAKTPPLPNNWRGGLPPEALPPGPEGQAYLQKMLSRAERGGVSGPTRSVSNGALPPLDASGLDPRGSGGFGTRTLATLQPEDTIAYQGTRISADQAVRFGLLVPDRVSGGYRLANPAELQAAQSTEPEVQEQKEQQRTAADLPALREAGEEPDAETQDIISKVTQMVPGTALNALVRDAAQNGSVSQRNLVEVAKGIGMSSEAAQGLAQSIWSGVGRQAARVAVAAGVPAEEVNELWSWAQTNRTLDHKHAVLAIAQASETIGIKALAKAFLAHRRDIARNNER